MDLEKLRAKWIFSTVDLALDLTADLTLMRKGYQGANQAIYKWGVTLNLNEPGPN